MTDVLTPGRRESTELLNREAEQRPERRFWLLLAALAAIALVLRLYYLDGESLWYDEAYTLLFSQLSLPRLILVGGLHEHPPFFYLLVHALFSLDDSYLVPRVLAAVAGACSVVVLCILGARLFNSRVGLVAGALLAVSPFHLWHSQDGRAYELAGLFVLLSYLSLVVSLDRPRRRTWIAYAAVTGLALYTDYTMVFILLPQGIVILQARRRGVAGSLIRAWLGITLAYLPWIGVLAANTVRVVQHYWVPAPTWNDVSGTILEFLGLTTSCPTGTECIPQSPPIPLLLDNGVALAVGVGVLTFGLVVYAFRRQQLALSLVTLWLALPFILLLAISTVRPLFLDRYLIGATYPLYLLLGLAGTRAWRRGWKPIVGSALLVTVLAASLYDTDLTFATKSNPDWKAATHDFQSAYRAGQPVAFYPGVLQTLVAQYLPRGWHPGREQAIWLRTYLDIPGWQNKYGTLTDYQLRDLQLTALTAGERQVWVVAEDYAGLWDVWHWFTTHNFYLLLDERYAGGPQLELWSRGPAASFGPAVVPDNSFGKQWNTRGKVVVINGVARASGPAVLTRSFPLQPGMPYTVNTAHRSFSLPEPRITVRAYATCRRIGGVVHGVGKQLARFPRLKHFDLWVNHTWIAKPFGFIAPPGATCGILHLQSFRGITDWRHIAIYRAPLAVQPVSRP